MSVGQPQRTPEAYPGLHIATIAHGGLLWDTYLEFDGDPHQPRSFRGRLRFNQDGSEEAPASTQTTVIIIEESYEEAVARARSFDDRQLQALLSSALPNPE